MYFPFLNIFYRPLARPLHKQIQHFITWKRVRYPRKADSFEYELTQFFKSVRVNCASQLRDEDVSFYLSGLNGEFRRNLVRNALKQFLTYWYRMGLLEREFTSVVSYCNISKRETNMHTEQVVRVQRLREKGMSFRQIKLHMETEDSKRYDVHQLHRWAKYELSTPSSQEC